MRTRMSKPGAALAALGMTGCTYTPPMDVDGPKLKDIVLRSKCEIREAMLPYVPQGEYPTGNYQWMRDWSAKVELTLQTQDQGGASPGVSFIQPLHKSTIAGLDTFQRSFTFGLGGGVGTTASRTEVMSFTVTLEELRRSAMLAAACKPAHDSNLLGDLGLSAWLDSAMVPVDTKVLTLGYHPTPGGGGGGGSTAKKSKQAEIALASNRTYEVTPDKIIGEMKLVADEAEAAAEAASAFVPSIKQKVNKAKADSLAGESDAYLQGAQAGYAEVQRLEHQADIATARGLDIAELKAMLAEEKNGDIATPAFLKRVKDQFAPNGRPPKTKPTVTAEQEKAAEAAEERMASAKKRADAARTDGEAAWKTMPANPPIDSLSHSVSFAVTWSASASPNWSLTHFKGPSNNSLLSASRAFTHSLAISLGAPDGGSFAPPPSSEEQRRQINNMRLETILNKLTLPSQ